MGNCSTLIYIVDKRPGEDLDFILDTDEFSELTDRVLDTLFENIEIEPDDRLIENILLATR